MFKDLGWYEVLIFEQNREFNRLPTVARPTTVTDHALFFRILSFRFCFYVCATVGWKNEATKIEFHFTVEIWQRTTSRARGMAILQHETIRAYQESNCTLGRARIKARDGRDATGGSTSARPEEVDDSEVKGEAKPCYQKQFPEQPLQLRLIISATQVVIFRTKKARIRFSTKGYGKFNVFRCTGFYNVGWLVALISCGLFFSGRWPNFSEVTEKNKSIRS